MVLTPEQITRTTFRYEVIRSVPAGVLETVTTTFAILIAERVFNAGDVSKELALMGGRGGLAASFVVVWLLSHLRRPLNQLVAILNFASGLCFLLAAVFHRELWAFVAGVSLGMFWFGFQTPLLTTIYRDNYPDLRRGQLYALSSLSRSAATIVFAWLAGRWLDHHLDNYRWLLAVFTGCSLASGWLLWRIPCRRVGINTGRANLWNAFRWLRLDPIFRLFLIAYMLMGLANLVMEALRTEYLVNPIYGNHLPSGRLAGEVAMLTAIIPNVFKMGSGYFWGLLFDRIDFVVLRLILNLFFAASIALYFLGPSYAWWWAGAALFGIGLGGGNVVWNLWVTKIAPAGQVSEYMSVHTFLTGLRGLVAPVIAFRLAGLIPISWMAVGCTAMILAACLLLLPERRQARATTEPPPLEEV